jgi:hypothetical protein
VTDWVKVQAIAEAVGAGATVLGVAGAFVIGWRQLKIARRVGELESSQAARDEAQAARDEVRRSSAQIRFTTAQPQSGDNEHTMFRVLVINDGGAHAAGIFAVIRGGGVELGRDGPHTLASDSMGDYTVETRNSPFRWLQPFGWEYTGEGDLIAEIESADGEVLATFPMPHRAKR